MSYPTSRTLQNAQIISVPPGQAPPAGWVYVGDQNGEHLYAPAGQEGVAQQNIASPLASAAPVQNQITPAAPSTFGGAEGIASEIDKLYARIGAVHGVPGAAPTVTSDMILEGWQSRGFDISNPSVRQAADLAAQLDDPDQQAQMITDMGNTFASDSKYAAPTGTYYSVYSDLGLADVTFNQGVTPTEQQVEAGLKSQRVTGQGVPAPTKGQEYQFVNGVYYYSNGVIADPATGNLLYDPKGGAVPGSPEWLHNAQTKWSDQAISNWRSELYKMGYSVGKKGGWDQGLIDATNAYYRAKYLNGNIPVRAGKAGGGTTGTKTSPLDLQQLHASIQSQVQQQFRSVFNQDPTPDELKAWTSKIIDIGMQLQKGYDPSGGGRGLPPDAALGEAEARAARRISNSPVGQAYTQHMDENTSLHNAMISAISAVGGL